MYMSQVKDPKYLRLSAFDFDEYSLSKSAISSTNTRADPKLSAFFVCFLLILGLMYIDI